MEPNLTVSKKNEKESKSKSERKKGDKRTAHTVAVAVTNLPQSEKQRDQLKAIRTRVALHPRHQSNVPHKAMMPAYGQAWRIGMETWT